ncbi:hypothetical protein OOK48_34905 [Streptomyces viridodiastaticus]|uniref:hypothetical protein n=1 Tax=Streptomyces albogriseolus TaxID=1887 RepID=UPI00225206B2|nr:hypothetical protein [Streptomyces viridodiastaticus]MCX4571511.1 hypothetical protein [Streptomyces viridodiastaticus]
MRRPAQHPARPAAPAWAHPYTGLAGLAVFYNDGGDGGGQAVPAPAPTPAVLANRPNQIAPAPPANDDEERVSITQRRLNVIMRDEKEEGRRAAYRAIAEAAGLDPDTFDPAKFGDVFKQAEAARQQQLSEEQRRAEELERERQAVQAEKAKADQERAEIQAERRALAREQALTRLGALDVVDENGTVTTPNLQDALAMLERDLRDTPDADTATLAAAAEALKKRRPELFGAPAAPQTLPPAPSGGPAGGNAPRQPASTKDAVREAARKRAEAMGLRHDAA